MRDARHTEVALLGSGETAARLFPTWDMRHDPARSWLWTPAAIAAGAATKAPLADVRAIFARVASEAA